MSQNDGDLVVVWSSAGLDVLYSGGETNPPFPKDGAAMLLFQRSSPSSFGSSSPTTFFPAVFSFLKCVAARYDDEGALTTALSGGGTYERTVESTIKLQNVSARIRPAGGAAIPPTALKELLP